MSTEDLLCDRYDICGETVLWMGTLHATEARARARGWHIFYGYNLSGDVTIEVHLCKGCVGSPRSRLDPAPPVLDGQLDLFP